MFTINNKQWNIKFVYPDNSMLWNGTDFALGACDGPTQIIYISNILKGYKLKKVLCHEIVHAAMFSYDIGLNYEQEELLADLIATYGEEIIKVTNEMFKRLSNK